jgi:16S rRNA (guanine527-N7)-methyltransferase
MTEAIDKLASFCERNTLPWTSATEEGFRAYLELLLHFNRSMNLIGPMSEADVVDGLLIDSLAAAAVCGPAGSILDVGTGAGLPGIPIKLVFDGCALTLVEPRRKRATFLQIAANRLDLDGVTVQRRRIEALDAARYDYVISKAFQPPVRWLETAAGWVSAAGTIVCMTRPDKRSALEARAGELGLALAHACDDTQKLGAPPLGDVRATYCFEATGG